MKHGSTGKHRIVALAALAGAAALDCAAPGAGGRPVPVAPAERALPEPDPSCRNRVQGPMRLSGVEQVTAKVAVDAAGRVTLVQFLAPDLTPSQRVELRRAMEGCLWRPAIGPDGKPEPGDRTLVIGVAR
ncbi:hypothetical protein [Anaeromyxobacter paludicola]|uniref:TonB C-terminal domain-containing protein n=1 Tax=Anaeromyxobacter paludicola TaxID=2918171 RepID=A0ABM7XA52_9BACT|nr:hypothetical protein [Anaeromyxobacter paludicola]BDG08732.1 hypothetical protein AMPC_18450 [Anaeromyxobacter paludicola]